MVHPEDPRREDQGGPERDPRGFDPRHGPHQPANPADLEAFPPAGPECARTRGLLRDFVDDDLTAAERSEVESHVHECRACGIALARAELENLQIRQAFDEIDPGVLAPGAGFTAGVLGRLDWSVEGADVPPEFTSDVMAKVLAEVAADEPDADVEDVVPWWRQPRLAYTGLAAVLLLSAVLAGALWTEPDLLPTEVVRARSAVRVVESPTGPVHERLRRGTTLRDGEICIVGEQGELAVRLGGAPGQRADVLAAAASEMVVDAAGVRVTRGEFEFEVAAALDIHVEQAGRLELESGRFELTMAPVRHQDRRVGVRAQLTVLDGLARVIRGAEIEVVEPNELVTWNSFGSLRVDIAPDRSMFAASVRRGARRDDPVVQTPAAGPQWAGRLVDARTSQPVAGATVTLRTFLGPQSVVADADGAFRFDIEGVEGQFGLLTALPPAGRGLAALQPRPVRLVQDDVGSEGFALEPEHVLQGLLLDADNRAVVGAAMAAYLVDELFGLVAPIRGGVARTDKRGGFTLRGLATRWPNHHSVLVLAQPRAGRPQLVLSRRAARAEDSALRLRLPRSRFVTLHGVQPHAAFHLAMPVQGIPVAWGAFGQTVRSDAGGSVRVDASGPVYVLGAGAPQRIDTSKDGATFREVAVKGLPPAVGRGMVRQGSKGQMHWFVRTNRFDAGFLPVPETGGLVSVLAESTGHACYGSHLFLVEDGAPRFLGVYAGHLRCDAAIQGELVVVTPEGQVGRHVMDAALGLSRVSVWVPPNGVLVRGAGATRGTLRLFRRTSTGLWPVFRNLADESFEVLPGEYQLEGQTVAVAPGSRVSLPASNR